VIELGAGQLGTTEQLTQDAPIGPSQVTERERCGRQTLTGKTSATGSRQGHHPPGGQGEKIVERVARVVEIAQAPCIAIAAAGPHGEQALDAPINPVLDRLALVRFVRPRGLVRRLGFVGRLGGGCRRWWVHARETHPARSGHRPSQETAPRGAEPLADLKRGLTIWEKKLASCGGVRSSARLLHHGPRRRSFGDARDSMEVAVSQLR